MTECDQPGAKVLSGGSQDPARAWILPHSRSSGDKDRAPGAGQRHRIDPCLPRVDLAWLGQPGTAHTGKDGDTGAS